MSKTLWIALTMVGLAAAQPQMVNDGAGVAVNMNGSQLLHRSGVLYPADALAKSIEGTIVVQVKLDANGEVIDAAVLSGPDELRKGVLQSVLAWHFDKSAALTTRLVNIDFVKPPASAIASAAAVAVAAPQVQIRSSVATGAIERIDVAGLSDEAKARLLAQLPVHAGDSFSAQAVAQAQEAVRKFDPHLSVMAITSPTGGRALRIAISPGVSSAPTGTITAAPGAIRVAGAVQQANLISQPMPEYTPLARAARVQGTVRFEATIGKDGTVQDLKLMSGPPLLIQSAMDAVKKWVYKPTLLNNNPVEVATTIDVTFTLAQEATAQ